MFVACRRRVWSLRRRQTDCLPRSLVSQHTASLSEDEDPTSQRQTSEFTHHTLTENDVIY
eukprot:scaffold78327_cov30-Phaeocystis_antarctica.AAC.1